MSDDVPGREGGGGGAGRGRRGSVTDVFSLGANRPDILT